MYFRSSYRYLDFLYQNDFWKWINRGTVMGLVQPTATVPRPDGLLRRVGQKQPRWPSPRENRLGRPGCGWRGARGHNSRHACGARGVWQLTYGWTWGRSSCRAPRWHRRPVGQGENDKGSPTAQGGGEVAEAGVTRQCSMAQEACGGRRWLQRLPGAGGEVGG
jgi:hypothetical protein